MRVEATAARTVLCRAVLILSLGLCAHAAPADDLADSLARAYAGADYQTAMPGATGSGDAAQSSRQETVESETAPPDDTVAEESRSESLSDVIHIAGLVALGVLVLAIAYIVIAVMTGVRIGRRERDIVDAGGGGGESTEESGAQAIGRLGTADRLAQQGRYAEAIHMLLLAVVAALRERMGGGLHASATAREMVRRAGLAEAPGGAFRALVHAAELIHFGGRDADRARYEDCRDSAGRVLEALGGSGR